MATQTIAEKDISSNLHPYTNHLLHEQTGPKTYVRGEGIYIWDEHGKNSLKDWPDCGALHSGSANRDW